MAIIHTGSLWVWKDDPRTLDITVKSGAKEFSPTWDMVMEHKNGTLSDERYTSKYFSMMRKSIKNNRSTWDDILSREEVILACYCPPGAEFCHRYILAEIFVLMGGELGQELLGGKSQLTKDIPRISHE